MSRIHLISKFLSVGLLYSAALYAESSSKDLSSGEEKVSFEFMQKFSCRVDGLVGGIMGALDGEKFRVIRIVDDAFIEGKLAKNWIDDAGIHFNVEENNLKWSLNISKQNYEEEGQRFFKAVFQNLSEEGSAPQSSLCSLEPLQDILGNQTDYHSLLNDLKSSNLLKRRNAAQVLAKFRNEAKEIVEALLPVLKDEDTLTKINAIQSIRALNEGGEEVCTALSECIEDSDEQVKIKAMQAIDHFLYKHRNIPCERSIIPLLKAKEDKSHDVSFHAGLTLIEVGPPAAKDLPEVFKYLMHENKEVRARALMPLGKYKEKLPEGVLEAVVARLNDSSMNVRLEAVDTLGKLGALARPAALTLLKLGLDGSFEERNWTDMGSYRIAFKAIGLRNSEVVQALIPALSNRDFYVQNFALEYLSSMGELAAPAVEAIIRVGPHTEYAYQTAIRSIGEKAIPALFEALKDPALQSQAFRGLSVLKTESVLPALPQAVEILKTGNELTKREAMAFIGTLNTQGVDALEVLISLLDHEDDYVRADAIWTLGKIGKASELALPKLLKLFTDDKDWWQRMCLAFAFGSIGPSAREILPLLRADLTTDVEKYQRVLVWAIAQIEN